MKSWKAVAILELNNEVGDLVACNYEQLFPVPTVGVQYSLENGIYRVAEPPTGFIGESTFDSALLDCYRQLHGDSPAILTRLERLRYQEKRSTGGGFIILPGNEKPEFAADARLIYIQMTPVKQRFASIGEGGRLVGNVG